MSPFSFSPGHLDADDRGRTDDSGCHDRRQTDRSGSEDGDACSPRNRQRGHYGAGAGLQTAPQRRQKLQGQVIGNLDEVAFGGQHVGGKRGLAEEVPADAATLQRIAAVQPLEAEVRLPEARASHGAAASACRAAAAGLIGEYDRIAATDDLHFVADALYDARTFMAQNERVGPLEPVVAEVDVGPADARSNHTHQNLFRPRSFHLEGFDFQWTAFIAQNSGLNPIQLRLGIVNQRPAPYARGNDGSKIVYPAGWKSALLKWENRTDLLFPRSFGSSELTRLYSIAHEFQPKQSTKQRRR
jgi:hypothetical protein